MTLTAAVLLDSGMGAHLPSPVRRALMDIGIACNETVHAFNAADVELWRAISARYVVDGGPPWAERNVDDRFSIAGACCDNLAIALARSAAPYAVYASQVAVDVLAGRTPDLPDAIAVLPSQLLAAAEKLLPVVAFPTEQTQLMDQNDDLADARRELFAVIDDLRRSGGNYRYDAIGPMLRAPDEGAGELTPFPEALLLYASTLTWALGVHTGAL